MEIQVVEKFAALAETKAAYTRQNLGRAFVYAMLAGAYIGIGICLIFTLGAQLSAGEATAGLTRLVMGAGFGVALSLCIMCGSDLFTGNHLIMGLGAMTRRVRWADSCYVWGVNLLGNLAGSLLLAWMIQRCGLLDNETLGGFIVRASAAKINAGFMPLLFRGILCNVCVCAAVWCSQRLSSETAKLVMVWWCLFAFIGIGLEHSVANMTLLALGIFSPYAAAGEGVNWLGYLRNLAPVILGNMLGGIVFFALPYYYCSKSKGKAG